MQGSFKIETSLFYSFSTDDLIIGSFSELTNGLSLEQIDLAFKLDCFPIPWSLSDKFESMLDLRTIQSCLLLFSDLSMYKYHKIPYE